MWHNRLGTCKIDQFNGGAHRQVVERHYKTGMMVVWSGVTSASKSEDIALGFADDEAGIAVGRGVVFRVRTFSAVSVESFSVFPEEEVRK